MERAAAAHGTRAPRPVAGAARRRGRVLVVDDAGPVRRALASLLRAAGYEVATAASGAAALATLERRGVDLLLTDLAMPGMSGWELARAVRARRVTNGRGLPVCIGLYSAVLGGFTRAQLGRAEVDFAVTKLTDPAVVLDAVERNLAWSEVA